MNAMMHRGAIFCHDDRIRHDVHEIDDITDGYQKWQGTLPNFIRIDVVKISGIMLENGVNGIHRLVLLISNSADPNAWARKYLIDPSASWCFFVDKIIGMNLSRFNSIDAHRNNQLDLEIAMSVLVIKVDDTRIINGVWIKFIRLWRSRTPQYKLEALFCPANLN